MPSGTWQSLPGGLLINARDTKSPAELAQYRSNIDILRVRKQGHLSQHIKWSRLECLFRSVEGGPPRETTIGRSIAGQKDYLEVEEHERVVQKVCGFRGCPLWTFILLQCLT